MTNQDWLQIMVDSVVEKMTFQMVGLGKTKEEAINSVREQSCAGTRAWEIALSKIAGAQLN